MARKEIVEFVDDIDQSNADQTLSFALRGVEYEIDLSDANAAKLEKALAKYIAAGRKTVSRSPQRKAQASKSRGHEPAVVRAWARQQGIPVSERGRVSAELVHRWREARAAQDR